MRRINHTVRIGQHDQGNNLHDSDCWVLSYDRADDHASAVRP